MSTVLALMSQRVRASATVSVSLVIRSPRSAFALPRIGTVACPPEDNPTGRLGHRDWQHARSRLPVDRRSGAASGGLFTPNYCTAHNIAPCSPSCLCHPRRWASEIASAGART